jgi:alcohol dehydrogenase class IV
MSEGTAVAGMRPTTEYVTRAVADGADIEARANMLVASSMGATAFQKGLGAMHSLSHPCSANLGTHHGLTNAVVMPYVLVWNRDVLGDKLARLAAWLGLAEHSFAGVLQWVLELRRQIGIPDTLAELGVTTAHAKPFAPQAFNDPSTGGNPLPMNEHGFEALYLRCIKGDLQAA